MLIIGHRGARGYEPENTLRSFARAIDMGVDMIELDVHVIKTGELVVMHDAKVDRTTNGKGYIRDMTFEQLRKLDAGNGEKVPTLAEVCELVDRRVPVNIELKVPGTAGPTAQLIAQFMQEHGWQPDDFLVSSFNHHELRAFHQLLPDIRIGAEIDGIPLDYATFGEELGCYSINIGHEFITQEYIDDTHRRGLKMLVWTVNDTDEVTEFEAMGVDGIFSDIPDVTRAALAAKA